MYERSRVLVRPLGPYTPVPADAAMANSETVVEECPVPTALVPLAAISEQTQPVEAQTYVWCLEDSKLEKELWSFDEYLRNNAWRWI
jgi:hypothetical protein